VASSYRLHSNQSTIMDLISGRLFLGAIVTIHTLVLDGTGSINVLFYLIVLVMK
jgi:hypothetical protein